MDKPDNFHPEIDDVTVGLLASLPDTSNFRKRDSSRGILFKGEKVAMLNVTNDAYHKLPGGGFENSENAEEAFDRELIEETGCKAKILDYAGRVIETRVQLEIIQTSYIYLAEVVGDIGEPKFDEGEIGAGYELEWVSFDEARDILSKEKPSGYEAKFINKRDSAILEFYASTSFYPFR